MKTAIYTRVSTTEQAEKGYGLEVQLEKCQAMATVKDFEVIAILTDEGISGTKDESHRPALAQLLQMAENKEIEAVIFYALDRLGRNTKLILEIVDQLQQNDIALISCKESLDTTTPTGKFMLTIFAGLAQLERDNIVEKTTNGRNQRGKIDGEKGGSVPFGYIRIIHPSEIVIDDNGASVVRTIFNYYDNEKLSLNKIAKRLNKDGIKPPKGKKWYAKSVSIIIGNRDKYQGGQRGDSQETWPKIL